MKEDTMFAVLKTGGKQYRVQSGDVLRVEKLAAEPGDKVQFNDILMIGGTIGAPLVAGAAVEPGTLSQRAMDAALEFGTGLVRKALDRAGKGGDKGSDKGSDKGAAGAANPS